MNHMSRSLERIRRRPGRLADIVYGRSHRLEALAHGRWRIRKRRWVRRIVQPHGGSSVVRARDRTGEACRVCTILAHTRRSAWGRTTGTRRGICRRVCRGCYGRLLLLLLSTTEPECNASKRAQESESTNHTTRNRTGFRRRAAAARSGG
jgi:hypothetical protein